MIELSFKMTYQQTLDYLYNKLPMFTRVGAAALKKDLHNTIALCEAIDNLEHTFRSVRNTIKPVHFF